MKEERTLIKKTCFSIAHILDLVFSNENANEVSFYSSIILLHYVFISALAKDIILRFRSLTLSVRFLKNHNSSKAKTLSQCSPSPCRVLKGRFSQKAISNCLTFPRALGELWVKTFLGGRTLWQSFSLRTIMVPEKTHKKYDFYDLKNHPIISSNHRKFENFSLD